MDQGHKHFSHLHNLIMHHMPEAVVVSCSGCKASATETVYVCWQCNFFLHEQCYRATRSLKHPSHPPHPLTLVPYPTYASNSFYCNSCQITGTGFSYSCADCEFDLHVRCAYSISSATNLNNVYPFQELAWNGVRNSGHESLTIPFNGAQNPYLHTSVSIPTSNSHNSSVQYSSMTQTKPYVSIPTNPSNLNTSSLDPPMPKNELKDKELMHFSHSHNLSRVDSQDEDEVICSGCEETVVGNRYSCAEPDCNFHLHESCFHLIKEIHHKSHPEHALTLLPLAPYHNKNGEFTCNACFSDGTGFTYHCSTCQFDLHIKCVSLRETVKRDDHKHTLKLVYSYPLKDEYESCSCDVCHRDVPKECWMYYCGSCDYGTHVGCVDDCEECENDSILDTQSQLQMLQIQMEMARQQTQMFASMGTGIKY